jgi:hypothetical protein
LVEKIDKIFVSDREGVKKYGDFANFGFLYIKKTSNFDK